jgi:hypothetical protein
VKNHCRHTRIGKDIAAEHLKLNNEVVDQNGVISRLRLKTKEDDSKVQMAKISARDTKEFVFGTLVVGICIVYALCAPFVIFVKYVF